MFETLLAYPAALERHRMAPLYDERVSFLEKLRADGRGIGRLRTVACLQLQMIRLLRLREMRGVHLEELKLAARIWQMYSGPGRLGNANLLSSVALLPNSASPTFRPTALRPRAASSACGALFKIALPVNSASRAPPICPPPARPCAVSCPTTIVASVALLEKRKRLGVRPPKISVASAASSMSASSAMTMLCNGTAAVSKSRRNQNASASPVPRFSSANHFEVASRSTTETASFIMRTNNEVTLSSGR